VDEHDASRPQEPPEVDQVDEDSVETVVAVDEREVEPSTFAQKARERDLRSRLGVAVAGWISSRARS
jgi:hypothetical protein